MNSNPFLEEQCKARMFRPVPAVDICELFNLRAVDGYVESLLMAKAPAKEGL